jgi:hypothetical protein
MYGSATLAIEVSSSSMNAAIVTVTAMNQGFTAVTALGGSTDKSEDAV